MGSDEEDDMDFAAGMQQNKQRGRREVLPPSRRKGPAPVPSGRNTSPRSQPSMREPAPTSTRASAPSLKKTPKTVVV